MQQPETRCPLKRARPPGCIGLRFGESAVRAKTYRCSFFTSSVSANCFRIYLLLERGLRQPTLATIIKPADVLQIQPDKINSYYISIQDG
jgi:hypothetical protein